jgi:hypothetical protein
MARPHSAASTSWNTDNYPDTGGGYGHSIIELAILGSITEKDIRKTTKPVFGIPLRS